MNADDLSAAVKTASRQAGFARVGIAPASVVPHAERLERWLARGWHAGMGYMASNPALRTRPDRLVPGARSVICLAAAYAPDKPQPPGAARVGRYARGRDYHKVLKRRCRALMDPIRSLEPSFQGRAFVDSAPVMERSLAAAAGVGWIGRNGCLIAPGLGSYVLLAEIVCNLPLAPDEPTQPQCGDCRRCLAACPTGALHEDGLVDARACISYLTVEHAGRIDPPLWPRMGTSVFGCDACQEACPHNRDLPAGDAELAGTAPPLGAASIAEILAWDEDDWDRATRGSAARRAGWRQWLRNAAIAAGNVPAGSAEAPPLAAALRRLGAGQRGLGEIIDWALGRLERSPA